EVLRAMAGSPTEVSPVLDAIAENAARFSRAEDVSVLLVRGSEIAVVSHYGPIPAGVGALRFDRTSIAATAILDGKTVAVADVLGPEGEPYQQARDRVAGTGQRGLLAAPLMRE